MSRVSSCLTETTFWGKDTYFVLMLNIQLVFISQEKEKSGLGHGTFSRWAQMGPGEYVLAGRGRGRGGGW